MLVNSGDWLSWYLSYELSNRVSFPVYQEGYFMEIWQLLQGGKDDILVYDRCGLLTYHLRMPYSFLSYPYVEGAIRVTYHGYSPCEYECDMTEGRRTAPIAPSTGGGNYSSTDEIETGLNFSITGINETYENSTNDSKLTTSASGNHSDAVDVAQDDSLEKLPGKHRLI